MNADLEREVKLLAAYCEHLQSVIEELGRYTPCPITAFMLKEFRKRAPKDGTP